MIGERFRCTAANARFARAAGDACAHGALQKEGELAWLLERADAIAPRTIVEVGCDVGGGLRGLRVAFPDSLIVGVDLPGILPYASSDASEAARRFDAHGALMVWGNSHDPRTLAKVRTMTLGAPVDLLVIDADHSWEGIQADWRDYVPLVRPGGLVALHDICPDGLHPFPIVGVPEWWMRVKAGKCPHGKRVVEATELVCDPIIHGCGIGLVTLGEHEKVTFGPTTRGKTWWKR